MTSSISSSRYALLCIVLFSIVATSCITPVPKKPDSWTYSIISRSDASYKESLRDIVDATAGQPTAVVFEPTGEPAGDIGTVATPSATSVTYEDVYLSSVQDTTIEVEFRADNGAIRTSSSSATNTSDQPVGVQPRSIPIRSLVRIDEHYKDNPEEAKQRRRQERIRSLGSTLGTLLTAGAIILLGLVSLMAVALGLQRAEGPFIIIPIIGILGLAYSVVEYINVFGKADDIDPNITKPSSKVRRSWFVRR